jgi:hypothetical protein
MKVVRSFATLFLTGVLAIVAVGFARSEARADVTNVLSYQAWKAQRLEEAKTNLEKVQKPTLEAIKKATPGAKASRSDQRLQQAQLNLDIAQELTVNDYFVLYLTQFKQREAFVEVAKKLTPEETADLMMSYQKHLAGSSELEIMAPSATTLGGSVSSTR